MRPSTGTVHPRTRTVTPSRVTRALTTAITTANGTPHASASATLRPARALGPGGGLLAATRIEAQQPTWIVTGVDEAGVAAAAAALSEAELQDRFALAVEQGRTVPLPAPGPGQAP